MAGWTIIFPLVFAFLFPAFPVFAGTFEERQVVDVEAGLEAVVVTIPPSSNTGFGVIDIPVKQDADNVLKHWRPGDLEIIINGGYFNSDWSPTGYCRVGGRRLGSARPTALAGFVAIDATGRVHVLKREDDIAAYPTVLQCGPFVIDPGGTVGIHSAKGNPARRTLIGSNQDGSLVIISTKPILLYDLARAIKKHLPSIERLLNLDGGPSSALVTDSRQIVNTWPVRNYICKAVPQFAPAALR